MAAMTTVLVEFATSGDSRTYSLPAHTVLKPQLIIQKRRVPTNGQTVAESTINVLSGTVDAESLPVSSKVSFQVTVRYPTNGQQADIDAMLAIFRDVVAGDEFANTVNTQEFLK